jgi:hypothetical protein
LQRHAKLLIIIYLIIASPIESIRQILNAIFFLAMIRACHGANAKCAVQRLELIQEELTKEESKNRTAYATQIKRGVVRKCCAVAYFIQACLIS